MQKALIRPFILSKQRSQLPFRRWDKEAPLIAFDAHVAARCLLVAALRINCIVQAFRFYMCLKHVM